MYSFSKKWDLTSLILYVLMAVIGAVCFYVAKKKREGNRKKAKIVFFTFCYMDSYLDSFRII